MDSSSNVLTETLSKLADEIGECSQSVMQYVRGTCQQESSSTRQGISLLDIKNDAMLSYLINLAYVIYSKCCGGSLAEDEVVGRLVELRTVLEKIGPMEQKLKYQIEKLVKSRENVKDTPENYRANIADMLSGGESDEEEVKSKSGEEVTQSKIMKKAGLYVAPKVVAIHYNLDESRKDKRAKLLERAKKRAANSSVMQELKEEFLDVPVEICHRNTLRNQRLNQEKEREEYEETYFTRLPITKKDKHRDKLVNSLTMSSLGGAMTQFEDMSALEGKLTAKKRGTKRSKSASKSKFKAKSKKKLSKSF